MQTVLVTGAEGFVGWYLVKRLLADQYRVIATGRGSELNHFTHPSLTWETLDFTRLERVIEITERYQPDMIIHSGAVSKPDACEQDREMAYRSNVTGTQHMLTGAAAQGAYFLFLSTDFVFDGKKGMYSEEDERDPVNYYGYTKVLAEDTVFAYAYGWSVARTVLVYGRNHSGRPNIITNVAESLKAGKVLKLFTDQERTPTYVEDLAGGIARMIKQQVRGIYHLSGTEILSPYNIGIETARYLQLDTNQIIPVLESEFDQPARRPPKTGFTITKAVRDLDYHPVPFREGLNRSLGAPE
ncbi:MAG TPA: SDR family oxidoreductase [Flavisolibacter sp.]|jgi:dTDP-4-dehydrorhamnose reductase|nr:SDR family oxidoreductase [Flavisolibacter sp.]